MVQSTVRFPEDVLDAVQQHTDNGLFANQSEFQRFAVEYLLTQLDEDYEPTLAEFTEIRGEALETDDSESSSTPIRNSDQSEFLQTAVRVRQYAMRGDIETAYELIDTRYAPDSPMAMVLDLLVQGAANKQAHTAYKQTRTVETENQD